MKRMLVIVIFAVVALPACAARAELDNNTPVAEERVDVTEVSLQPEADLFQAGPPASFLCSKGALDSARAEKILKEVQVQYRAISRLTASFNQESYLEALDVSESSSGSVWFEKPGRMKWEYRAPEEQTFILKEKTFWHYQPIDNQVLIDQVDQVLISDLPVAFLMGVGNLSRDFSLVKGCTTSSGVLFTLAPSSKKETDPLKQFELLIDGATKLPAGARITHVGGNQEEILLENLRADTQFPDAVFEPQFPDGTVEWDRRLERRAAAPF